MRDLLYKIRKLRELADLSVEQMAVHLEISARMYRKIEAGEGGMTIPRLCRIAERLGCRPGDLLNESLDELRVRVLLLTIAKA